MGEVKSKEVVVGKITSVYGVKGWVKVHSFTEPPQGILDYPVWNLEHNGRRMSVNLVSGKTHGKGLVAFIKGYEDRDAAQALCGSVIKVSEADFPELDEGEYYWKDLIGLQVKNVQGISLGAVTHLMETGSNDVLVIKGKKGDVDDKERLIPYRPEVVLKVDLDQSLIEVDWDPEF
jgi:16S rRNA processing protein RimM